MIHSSGNLIYPLQSNPMKAITVEVQNFLTWLTILSLAFPPIAWFCHREYKRHKSRQTVTKKLDEVLSFLENAGIDKINETIVAQGVELQKIRFNIGEMGVSIEEISRQSIAAMKISDSAMFFCNEAGECTEANLALCQMFGATEDQMIGFGWSQFIITEDRKRAVKEWEEAFETDIDIKRNYRIKHGYSGKIIKVNYRAIIMRDKKGQVIQVLGKCYLETNQN